MRRLAAVILCLSVIAAVTAIVRPAAAFEVQSGGVPLSAAAVSMLAHRAGSATPAAAGPGGAFPPWMGSGRTSTPVLGSGPMGGGLTPPGRPAGVAADRAAMNEQLFGIKR
ncbi:hypothetical protein J2848_003584 [Azospirillum lipoferum]|uniref:Uncharacterized protein n=1 Tax=Azospirillum lipoferum TaxID=193 RepID=A0A5A9GLD9_AZOLI|nr:MULTISPECIES: hypothetical protein [Azospirillum]KAA0595221.1 hypothetical protein FZ942_16395 [Azospirillum lipoferum]MCP1611906.1 hypothetical protein [Azospirillum lipoferum]MDW5533335.1 hypothetical protein [Azospirillum sp. NL1]